MQARTLRASLAFLLCKRCLQTNRGLLRLRSSNRDLLRLRSHRRRHRLFLRNLTGDTSLALAPEAPSRALQARTYAKGASISEANPQKASFASS
ncbi:hypothetical protein CLOM_g12214 [Closterium sp. NIES-68]|nr:hypothetical protein CLOM_g2358 [Closterium sp. NIES-68]GJP53077.1 hypothetical protein CLOM_g12214 [Closterium sp. NIES-68]